MRRLLRWWRVAAWPTVECLVGPVDWTYCPAEYACRPDGPTRGDQPRRLAAPARQAPAPRTLARSSARPTWSSRSPFNTDRLIEASPSAGTRWPRSPTPPRTCSSSRPPAGAGRGPRDLGLPAGSYLLSVANFQPRKNLARLIRAAARLPEVAGGRAGPGPAGHRRRRPGPPIRDAIAAAGRRAVVRMPGYRQGRSLRAVYAEATALVFPSTCESFGIPAVEAMAQGSPSPWPTRPPSPRSAATPAGTSTRRTTTPSPPPSATPGSARERPSRAGSAATSPRVTAGRPPTTCWSPNVGAEENRSA